jgi:sec-independent protein translocase protein TatB
MFGLSFGEIVIIAVLALLLLGADRLPDAARTLGKGLREFRRATEDLKDQIQGEIYAGERPRPPAVPPVPSSRAPGPPPQASAENVPGLEAALAEPSSGGAEAAAEITGEAEAAEAGPPGSGPAPEGVADEPAEPERLA